MNNTLTQTRAASPKGASLLTRTVNAIALIKQRRALVRLGDAALQDIGVSRDAAKAEAKRSAWDAPAHWKR